MNIKIAMIQDIPGSGIRPRFWDLLREISPDIISFPEYYFVGPDFKSVPASLADHDNFIAAMAGWSRDLNCIIIGGTVVERDGGHLYNRCHIFKDGESLGFYDKIHLYKNEGNGLVTPGNEYKVISVEGFRIGLLICADVLYPGTFTNLKGLRPDMVIIPTTSPYRPGESSQAKFQRDIDIYAHGSEIIDCILFKTSACGNIVGHKLQGRSLIASPGKIEWRVNPEDENNSQLIMASITRDKRNPLLDIKVYRS